MAAMTAYVSDNDMDDDDLVNEMIEKEQSERINEEDEYRLFFEGEEDEKSKKRIIIISICLIKLIYSLFN